MIFRIGVFFVLFDAEQEQVAAQTRKRTFVQETGQIVGGIREQFAAAYADESVEILAIDLFCIHRSRCINKRSMSTADIALVAREILEPSQQFRVGSFREQHRE